MNRYWIAFWLVSFIYGSSFLLNSIALRELTPIELGFLRYSIGAIGLHVILVQQRRHIPYDFRTLSQLVLVGLGNHAVPFTLIVWAQTHLSSGLTSVFMATVPLYSLVIAHFVFTDERMNPHKAVGILSGFVGILILASNNLTAAQDSSVLLAELAVVAASAMSAATTIYSRQVIRPPVDALVITTGTMIASAIFMLIALLLGSHFNATAPTLWHTLNLSTNTALVILTLGLVNTLVANWLYYVVVSGLGASRSTLVTYVFPPISLALGALFLHEAIDVRIIGGTGVILGSLALATRSIQPASLRLRRALK